jgi:DNA-3-methyladenine glycosylase I
VKRCAWATSEITIPYHDEEWGVPVRDDRKLFELLLLEGAQAGLSWETILKKREGYRAAFAGFDPEAIARFDGRKQARLLRDPGIVRNRLKIAAAVQNARAFLALRREGPTFAEHLWSFVGGRPKVNRFRGPGQIPSRSKESDAMSADLRRRGFKFVGTTICYAFMEAVGMVDDHTVGCFRREASSRRERT